MKNSLFPLRIKEPIWNGGDPKVGIAKWKSVYPTIKVVIIKKRTNGERIFPYPFYIKGHKITKYPKDKKKHFLHIVPLKDMEVK